MAWLKRNVLKAPKRPSCSTYGSVQGGLKTIPVLMANRKNFLVCPGKPASEVDIASRVTSYMETCMSLNEEVKQAVKEGLNVLNQRRRNAFFNDDIGKTLSSVEALHLYYDTFVALDEKIPIRDGECPIPFRWKSAFDKGGLFGGKRDLTHNYGSYEKACVLFNIAAYQSQFVATRPLQDDEELRQAVGFFKGSANIYNYLKDEVMHLIPEELPKDMQPQLLNALAQLMITQANEIMYIKAVKDKNSPAILKTVAMQLSDSYGQLYKLFNYEQARGIVDKNWYTVIQAKEHAYHAFAAKHQYDEIEPQKLASLKERLGRSREIVELLEKAADLLPKNFEKELADARNEKEKLDKDNNFIYHARVPSRTELPAIPRKLILQTGDLKFPFSKQFKDPFTELVSASVSKAVNLFQGKLKERVHQAVSQLRNSDNDVKAKLAAINMPALVEDSTKQERIPASIVKKSEAIRSKGGYHAIETKEKDLLKASEETATLINQIKDKLDQEELADEALRDHYSARWTCKPSNQLTMKFRQEIGKYLGINKTAQSADEKVRSKIRLCERDVTVMTGPREQLLERVPPIQSTGNDQSQAVEKLKELWTVMEKEMNMVQKLEDRLNDVKFDSTQHFVQLLKQEGQLEDSEVNSFADQKLNDLFQRLTVECNQNTELRTALIEEMKVWHQKFSHGGNEDDARSRALKQLTAAYDVFLECEGNLQEGAKFYTDLKALLTRLHQQIDDFCFARQTEREDMVQQMEAGKRPFEVIPPVVDAYKKKKGLNSEAIRESIRAPPPRPPPPSTAGQQPQAPPHSATPKVPDMDQLNLNPSAPQIPPRQSNAPLPPAHQQGPPQGPPGYQPNTQYNQWPQQYQQQGYGYGQPQQPFSNQQMFQPMPNLPFYGAYQTENNTYQQYAVPYPTQYPNHPQPQYNQQPPYQPYTQPPNSQPQNPGNPFS
ncbi:unnamed protein product [Bursaphelenchus okinawaensis]|uniref:BRO1 domain-containing protein n=1 Tax=Bursaphelenchus okinawaensis TaxID=465554 RepID=A0A811KE47_9BILA|nr:unnamed protein product [Bursaphelenchus okinawaensis]CAG9102784.1 unnamed protein product [Bursaphelenchus okinawaensis]